MKLLAPLLVVMLLAGCQAAKTSSNTAKAGSSTSEIRHAHAQLEPKSGSNAMGAVHFIEQDGQVSIEVKASGLKPNAEHAIHIHEKGDCSAADATSAGGHFNPDNQAHGHPNSTKRHAGDLPNLLADAQGQAIASFQVKGITLDKDFRGVLQRGVVIHASADDYTSQPAGNAGSRIACGVIRQM